MIRLSKPQILKNQLYFFEKIKYNEYNKFKFPEVISDETN